MTTQIEALKIARTAIGVQLDALLGKAGHLHNDDRRRYAENGIKAIDEALAQPEQEPVAYTNGTEVILAKHWTADYPPEGWKPLGYTTSPQRTWVGLTNDEINEFAAGCNLSKSVQSAIYEAEAKLKEKNT
jgi:hypothetical protein